MKLTVMDHIGRVLDAAATFYKGRNRLVVNKTCFSLSETYK